VARQPGTLDRRLHKTPIQSHSYEVDPPQSKPKMTVEKEQTIVDPYDKGTNGDSSFDRRLTRTATVLSRRNSRPEFKRSGVCPGLGILRCGLHVFRAGRNELRFALRQGGS